MIQYPIFVYSEIYPKEPQPITKERQEVIEDSLDELAKMLPQEIPWTLSGGIAIPLTLGKFYRNHYDIDIAFPESSLKDIVSNIEKHNYKLASRAMMMHTYRNQKLSIYKFMNVDEALSKRKSNMDLRLVKIKDGEIVPHSHPLHYIALFPHHYDTKLGCIISNEDNLRVPFDYLDGGTYITKSGKEMKLVNLLYSDLIRQKKKDKTSQLDREMIKKFREGQTI